MTETKPPSNYSLFKIVIGLTATLLVVIFALQNSNSTLVKVFFWEFNAPLVILFLLCFTTGIAIGISAIIPFRKYAKSQEKIIKELKTKLETKEESNDLKPL
jgi:uncharacterized integral membrane protein